MVRRGGVRARLSGAIEMSSKHGFVRRTAMVAALAISAVYAVAVPLKPAMADNWKKHHGYYYGGYGRYAAPSPVFYGGVFVAPPPVAYYPPPVVYVPPPPVVYAPAPVYYGPPSLSLGVTIPLH
jgi:hypothetical protein